MEMYKVFWKRLMDFTFALCGFIAFVPLFILVMLILMVANRGNPFFLQERPGKNGHIFKIIKFKTMNDRTDRSGNLLPDVVRLTTIGKFVRKTSLDEIPQLINVILGDMSLVGPRPLRTFYLPLYSDFQKRRHEVRPGITGWAQVNGRNSISWTEKFQYDVYYVDNVSFSLDVQILWKTISKVFRGKDVNASEKTTMVRFNGKN